MWDGDHGLQQPRTIHRSAPMQSSASSQRAKHRHQLQEERYSKKIGGNFGPMRSMDMNLHFFSKHSTCQSQPTSNQHNRINCSRLARREPVILSAVNTQPTICSGDTTSEKMSCSSPRNLGRTLQTRNHRFLAQEAFSFHRTQTSRNHHLFNNSGSILQGQTHQEEYSGQRRIRIPPTF